MIPKVIHYCWFGDKPKGKKELKCINSWKKYCPDYEIVEWNESNIDFSEYQFAVEAYKAKKFAFVSDIARLIVLKEHGGIYLDTDVELLKSYNKLLNADGFVGFENESYVNSGQCLAAEPNNKTISEVLSEYNNMHFIKDDGTFNMIACPKIITKCLTTRGLLLNNQLQNINGFFVYPTDYFNPYDNATGKINITENTYSIHWYSKTWIDKKTIIRAKIAQRFRRIFGVNSLSWLSKFLNKKGQ